MNNLMVFSGSSNIELSKEISGYIEKPLGNCIVKSFPDGEVMIKIEEDVRGKDCFVVQPTCPPVNDNLMELLIIIDCLKRASARSITAVVPYFGYARQDRKTGGRTPITARLVADLLSSAKVDRVLTMDLHADQIEGFFNVPVDHLKAFPVFVNYFKKAGRTDNTMVLSPDIGNIKIANMYARALDMSIAVIDKKRLNGNSIQAETLIGDVQNKDILIFDDMVSTAGTIQAAAFLAIDKGAKEIKVVATHGLFTNPAEKRLRESPISEVFVTNTTPHPLNLKDKVMSQNDFPKINVLSVGNLIGEAILRIYYKRSVSVLLESD